jgi:SAM-dependent methyltransferase
MEYVETSSNGITDISKIIRKYFPWKSVFYDLGSGRWSVLFPLSKLVPECCFFGVENIAFQIKFCRFLQRFWLKRENLNFIQEDFCTVNISSANMLFLYVPRILLPNLKKVLQAKMNKKQILILYRISFKDWTPIEIIPTDFVNGISQNNIYIYQNT